MPTLESPLVSSGAPIVRLARIPCPGKEQPLMLDLMCIGLIVLFFALAALFVRACEALENEGD